MNQPESPLIFDQVQSLIREDNQLPQIIFTIRNKTNKKITSFSVAFFRKSHIREWIPYGVGWEHSVGNKNDKQEIISPNGTYENISKKNFDLVPMTDKVAYLFREKNEEKSVKIVWIGMVKRVNFEDGTEFDMGNLSDKIANFLLDEK